MTDQSNPFVQTPEQLLERLTQANLAQNGGITDETLKRLRGNVPEVPEGPLTFLSLRIRLGEGQEGVQRTANAHLAEILRVHGERNVWRWDHLRTDKKHLRLWVGNETHKPVVKWCVIDLDTHRKRQSITAVRGPKSIADEGLVLAWLYPDYPRSIDYKENPGYFLGGYELNIPVSDDESWDDVPIVYRPLGAGGVGLRAGWRGSGLSGYAVSSLRE
ncbi:MAG: hypothetical protein ABIJ46_00335 [bacterium]